MPPPLYFDYNATAPLKPAVRDIMAAVLAETGNPSAAHAFGRKARARVETAREQVAALLKATPAQVIFNSGATEGNNTVLQAFRGTRVLVSAIEHSSVLNSAPEAEKIPVTLDGLVDLDALESLLQQRPSPALISVMAVNNETGVIQPLQEIGDLARRYGALFHCDAVQAIGKISLDMTTTGIDYLTLSGHKNGGPQGVGALILRDCTDGTCIPTPTFLHGGGQEQRRRAGTENVASIAGLGLTCDLSAQDIDAFVALGALRDRLEAGLKTLSPTVRIFGASAPRIANTSFFGVPGVDAKTIMMTLDLAGVGVGSGSACSSGKSALSHVLKAMGVDDQAATGAIRISLGWATEPTEIDRFLDIWGKRVRRLTMDRSS
ncbi:MAG: cysteine desulfurase [Alphaproteobacteria bacterium]|nr:cysteine desulfurase [Alphaproteobacteria bacterium]